MSMTSQFQGLISITKQALECVDNLGSSMDSYDPGLLCVCFSCCDNLLKSNRLYITSKLMWPINCYPISMLYKTITSTSVTMSHCHYSVTLMTRIRSLFDDSVTLMTHIHYGDSHLLKWLTLTQMTHILFDDSHSLRWSLKWVSHSDES